MEGLLADPISALLRNQSARSSGGSHFFIRTVEANIARVGFFPILLEVCEIARTAAELAGL